MPLWLSIMLSVSAALSLPTIAASLVGFLVSRRRERQRALQAQQRAAVERVLEVFERVAHRQTSWSRYWAAPASVDFTILYPRLLLELGTVSKPVADWLWRQVQLMLSAPSEKDTLRLGTDVALRLLAWQQGTTTAAWFEREIHQDPPVQGFVVPRSLRWRRIRRDFFFSAQLTALAAVFGWAVRRAL